MPWSRIAVTLVLIGLYSAAETAFTMAVPYIINSTGSGQMDGTAEGYLWSQLGSEGVALVYQIGRFSLAFLLMIIWGKYIIAGWTALFKKPTIPLILLPLLVLNSGEVEAYKSSSDYKEIYRLGPNETGIRVPLRGDGAKQASFGSVEQLRLGLVAAREVVIDHVELTKSSYVRNKVYNAIQLYVVEHAPYSNVWTHSKETGTAARDESLKCETLDSISIRADISVSAKIEEPVAYLFHFGTNPKKWRASGDTEATLEDAEDKNNASILYAQDIQHVMDQFARPHLQAKWCERIMAISLADLTRVKAGEAPMKIKALTDAVAEWEKDLSERGIKVISAGYANELTYPEEVQAAISRKFVAETNAAIAATLEKLAYIEAIHAFATGLKNGTVKMPENLVVVPEAWADRLKEAVAGEKK